MKHNKVQVAIFAKASDTEQWSVLLLKTNQERGLFWQNVTGSCENEDKNLDESASREVLEETGKKLQKLNILNLQFSFTDRFEREVTEFCFAGVIKFTQKVKISKVEHCEFKWVPVDEISRESYKFESNYDVFLEGLKVLDA